MRAIVMLVTVAACKDPGAPSTDSADAGRDALAPVDAASDGPEVDAPNGSKPVTVQIAFVDYPDAGVDVLFMRADGSLITAAVTGDDGRAEALLTEPGMVALHWQPGGGPQHAVWIYTAVPPGSDIYYGWPDGAPVAMTVHGPAYPGATAYQARITSCASSAPSASTTVTIAPSQYPCDERSPLLWLASTPTGDMVALVPEIDIHASSITVPESVTFHPAIESQTTTITGIPPEVDPSIDVFHHLGTATGSRIFESDVLGGPVSNGVASVTDQRPALEDEPSVLAEIWVNMSGPDGALAVDGFVDHAQTVTIDLAGKLIPFVSKLTYQRAARSWSWVETGAGAADATAALVLSRTPIERYFEVIAPHTGPQLTLPRLPPPLDYLNIEPDSQIDGVNLETMSRPGGYARFVADFEGVRYTRLGIVDELTVVSAAGSTTVLP